MDHIQKTTFRKRKKFYNIMSLEIYDILDPKREVKVKHEDMEYKNWLNKFSPKKYSEEVRKKYLKKIRRILLVKLILLALEAVARIRILVRLVIFNK